MKTKLIVFFFCVIILFTNESQGQSKVLLRLNLQKGNSYEMSSLTTYQIDNKENQKTMTTKVYSEREVLFKVLDVLPDKKFVIEYSFLNVKNLVKTDEKVLFYQDILNDGKTISLKDDILSMKLLLIVNNKGQIEKIDGMKDFSKEFKKNLEMGVAFPFLANEDSLKSNFKTQFAYLPDKEITSGDTILNYSLKKTESLNKKPIGYDVFTIKDDLVYSISFSEFEHEELIEKNRKKMNIKSSFQSSCNKIIDSNDGFLISSEYIINNNTNTTDPKTGEEIAPSSKVNIVQKISVKNNGKKNSVNYIAANGFSELMRYVKFHGINVGLVDSLISLGADIHYVNPIGQTAFSLACLNNNRDIAYYLLEHGASILETDTESNAKMNHFSGDYFLAQGDLGNSKQCYLRAKQYYNEFLLVEKDELAKINSKKFTEFMLSAMASAVINVGINSIQANDIQHWQGLGMTRSQSKMMAYPHAESLRQMFSPLYENNEIILSNYQLPVSGTLDEQKVFYKNKIMQIEMSIKLIDGVLACIEKRLSGDELTSCVKCIQLSKKR